MRSYLDAMLRYFEFSGRSTRKQYWLFFLVEFVLFGAAIYLDVVVGNYQPGPGYTGLPATIFVYLVHLVPALAVQVRRLHDVGRSGWWLLLNMVPFGFIFLLVWACTRSDDGDNDYGPPSGAQEARTSYYSGSPAMGRSTIPRQVRMGNGRTPSVGGGRTAPSAGRFI